MAHTTKVPLGAATYVRKWYLDINSGTYAAPNWVGVFGVTEFQAAITPSMQDDSDFDSAGWKSSSSSALQWTLNCKVSRKVTAALATAYDPGQELLRVASVLFGVSNQVDVRWYEVTASGPAVEAYRGYASVQWSPDGGSMEAESFVAITLTGRGAREVITHPDAAAAVPILYSITPATSVQAGGTMHILKGTNFTGTVSIACGVTNVPTYIVDDNQTIHVLQPAKAAGTFAYTVTNATGVSTVTVNIVVT